MVCKHCGSQLSINDEKCPFCGMVNTEALGHQREMKAYRQRFEQTSQTVIEGTKNTQRIIKPVLFIAAMLLLNLVVFIAHSMDYDIRSWYEDKQISSDQKKILADIEKMLADKDYVALSGYAEATGIGYSEEFRKYTYVFSLSRSYSEMMRMLMYWNGDYYGFERTESEIYAKLADYVNDLNSVTKMIEKKDSYLQDYYDFEITAAVEKDIDELSKALFAGAIRAHSDEWNQERIDSFCETWENMRKSTSRSEIEKLLIGEVQYHGEK